MLALAQTQLRRVLRHVEDHLRSTGASVPDALRRAPDDVRLKLEDSMNDGVDLCTTRTAASSMLAVFDAAQPQQLRVRLMRLREFMDDAKDAGQVGYDLVQALSKELVKAVAKAREDREQARTQAALLSEFAHPAQSAAPQQSHGAPARGRAGSTGGADRAGSSKPTDIEGESPCWYWMARLRDPALHDKVTVCAKKERGGLCAHMPCKGWPVHLPLLRSSVS